jgi:pimeloyl-ACP methyl ester carboxylesterase
VLRRLLIPLAALVLVPVAGAAAAPSGVQVAPCPGKPGVLCGSLDVPLDRGHPGQGTITVHFQIHRRTDTSKPALEPVLGIEGGPGLASSPSANMYGFLLGPVAERHDLITVDLRGTGASGAIHCPRLQGGVGPYPVSVGRCAQRLGDAANTYGTAAAVDDVAAILTGLRTGKVDVYGDSYGTYAAQALAVRHPDLVRAVVLDGAFPVDNSFDPFEREESARIRTGWSAVCARALGCPPGDVLDVIGGLAAELDRNPLRGTALDADGFRHHIDLDGAGLAQLVVGADFSYGIFRDLPAAARSYDAGDPAPLLRIAAENDASGGSGAATLYSEGAYAAVACHDYPTIWHRSASLDARRAQLADAIRALPEDVFAPFAKDVWLRSQDENQLVRGCLDWPQPKPADPAVPSGAQYPDMPVLVVNGDLDFATPLEDAQRAAALFPNSTMVDVHNTGHITALYDFDFCVSEIVRRFFTTLDAGDTGCASRIEEVHVAPAFPRSLATTPAATGAGTVDGRRAAWAAVATVGDAFARWQLMYSSRGHGLRGGSFTTSGKYFAHSPVSLVFHDARFVPGLRVSGPAVWDRRDLTIDADVTVTGPNGLHGTLHITWRTNVQRAVATVAGTVGGVAVRATTPAL